MLRPAPTFYTVPTVAVFRFSLAFLLNNDADPDPGDSHVFRPPGSGSGDP
jgi:hypothetical protein